MPLEMEHADGVDIKCPRAYDENIHPDELLPIAAEQLKDENLLTDEAEKQLTHVHLPETQTHTK